MLTIKTLAFSFALSLFPGVAVGALQANDIETAVRETAEYMCSRRGPIAVSAYYDLDDVGEGHLMRLKAPNGTVGLTFNDEQWNKADAALQKLASREGPDDHASCAADLVSALLPVPRGDTTFASNIPDAPQDARSRTFSFNERNGHCAGDREFSIPVRATSGWDIDTLSVEASVQTSSRSSFRGVYQLTRDGFLVVGLASNNGTCGPFWRDGRGHVWGAVHYTEIRESQ